MYCKHIVTMSLSTLSMIADFVAWICIWGGQTHCISFSWSELLYCNQLLRMCTRSFSGIFLNIHGSGRFRKFHCTYQPSIYRYLVLLQTTPDATYIAYGARTKPVHYTQGTWHCGDRTYVEEHHRW